MTHKISPQSIQVLLVQTIAVALLIIGVNQLLLIRDIDAVEMVNRYGLSGAGKHLEMKYGAAIDEKISSMLTRVAYANAVAVLIGCFLSCLIVWRNLITRLVPIALFILSMLVIRSKLYSSRFTLTVINWLHQLFSSFGLAFSLVATGILFIVVALLLFFNKQLNGITGEPSMAAHPL